MLLWHDFSAMMSSFVAVVANGCKQTPCGFWELNSGPLERAIYTLNSLVISSPIHHFFVTLNEAGSFACCEFDCYSELQVTAAVLLRAQMAMVLWDWELVIKIILFYAVSTTFCGKPLSVVFAFILICRQHFTSSFRLGSLYSLNSVSWFLYILYKHDPIIVENIPSLNCGCSFRYNNQYHPVYWLSRASGPVVILELVFQCYVTNYQKP